MEYLKFFSILFASQIIRYLLVAGAGYYYFWVRHKETSLKRKIQSLPFQKKEMLREFRYSMITSAVFAGILLFPMMPERRAATLIYMDYGIYGWWWEPVSLLLLIFIHDTYFYWMHRTVHHPKVYNLIHKVHHDSKDPTPFAAYSFHPLEAVLEFVWTIPLMYVLPFNLGVLIVFSFVSLAMNVQGHLGLELNPDSWRIHPVLKWFNFSTYHNAHHRYYKENYGLYFSYWDRWMGTLRWQEDQYLIEPQTRSQAQDLPKSQPKENLTA